MERALFLLDRGHPFNGVQVVSLRGPLSEDLLRSALARLQARHPIMRSRIMPVALGDERQLLLTDEGAGPIPLSIVLRQNADTWQAVVEQELNSHFTDDSDHLLRAVWVRGADGTNEPSELVFGKHHVPCDALSMAYAVRDFLADLGALAEGKAHKSVESLPLQPSLVELLPKAARGLRRFLAMQSFFYKHILGRPLRRARLLPIEQAAPPLPGQRRSGLVHRTLPPAALTSLYDAVRRQETTVHAALCAALLLATGEVAFAKETSGSQPLTVGFWSAVSLRGELSSPVGEEMGLYVSQVTTFHRIAPPPPFFALAKEVKAALTHTLKSGEQYLTMPLIGMFIPSGKMPGERFIRRFDGGSPAALGLTNIARIPIAPRYGPFHIDSCHFAVGPSVISPLLATSSTCGGALTLNLVHVEPLCARARAAAIADRAIAILLESGQAAEDLPHADRVAKVEDAADRQ